MISPDRLGVQSTRITKMDSAGAGIDGWLAGLRDATNDSYAEGANTSNLYTPVPGTN
jgi:hypothetical protein